MDKAIDEIYKVDLFEDKILTTRELKRPATDTIRILEKEGRQQRKEHHRFMESGDDKKAESAKGFSEEHWEARSPLFRSKRELELAQLLSVRTVLGRFFGGPSLEERTCGVHK